MTKLYSLTELADMAGITKQGMAQRFWKSKPDRSKIQLRKFSDHCGATHYEYVLTKEQVEQYNLLGKKSNGKKRTEVTKVKEDTRQMKLEELHKLYPLVTDDRCFQLSWFPDTTPECFKDLDEEETA